MRILGALAVALGLIAGGFFLWYTISYPLYTYRYRMTVEVESNGVLRSGSSVIEVQLEKQPRLVTAEPPVWPRVFGEAVFVDIGGGRNVIALVASGPNASNVDYLHQVVPAHFRLSVNDSDLPKYPNLQGLWKLSEAQMPTFVTFADLNDPRTAKIVPQNAFSEVFGSDVKLRAVTVEMTTDPVTREIFARLRWLKGFKGYSGGQPQPDHSKPEKNLTGNMFTQGALR